MQARLVQRGHNIDYTPAANVAAGDIVVEGEFVGIAPVDIPAGTTGALATVGVFDVAKGDGVALAFAFGASVFYEKATKKLAAAAGAGIVALGKCVADSPAPATTVRVRLNG